MRSIQWDLTEPKIQFKYFEYTIEKTRHFRKDGKFYVVSPYALTWDDENYYLVAYDQRGWDYQALPRG